MTEIAAKCIDAVMTIETGTPKQVRMTAGKSDINFRMTRGTSRLIELGDILPVTISTLEQILLRCERVPFQ